MAYKLLKDNFNKYVLYLILLSIAVATYYNFVSIQYNKSYIELTYKINSTMVASYTCGFVLIIAIAFFMIYVNNFFLEQRKKEIGLYMLMGITPSKIGKIFAIESILLGVLALVIGLPIGIIFSKLFFMLLNASMALEEDLVVDLSVKSIVQLISVFGSINILLGIGNYRSVKKSKLIDLFNATKVQSSVPEVNYFKGILGVVLIGIGYVLALMIKRWKLDLIVDSMCALLLVCIGTYIMYKYFFTILFKKLVSSKDIIYKRGRLVVANNLFFRLKDNYSTLAMTAILSAATISALGVSLSFKSYAADHIKIEAPYSFSYINDELTIDQKVMDLVNQSKHTLIGNNKVSFLCESNNYLRKGKVQTEEVILMNLDEFKRALAFTGYKDKKDLYNNMELGLNETLFINKPKELAPVFTQTGKKISFKDQDFTIIKEVQVPLLGGIKEYGNADVYVLNNEAYAQIKQERKEQVLNTFKITDEKHAQALMDNIKSVVKDGEIMPYVSQYVWEYYALETFSFLGCIMTVVFIFALFSGLYFKVLSEAYKDEKQYKTLLKVGMDKNIISRIIHLQVAFSFMIPAIIGILHSIVAIIMVQEIMDANFSIQLILASIIFIMVMCIFYLSISKRYIKMACGKN